MPTLDEAAQLAAAEAWMEEAEEDVIAHPVEAEGEFTSRLPGTGGAGGASGSGSGSSVDGNSGGSYAGISADAGSNYFGASDLEIIRSSAAAAALGATPGTAPAITESGAVARIGETAGSTELGAFASQDIGTVVSSAGDTGDTDDALLLVDPAPVVSIPTSLIVMDDDDRVKVPADWFKLEVTLARTSTADFDLAKQAVFNGAIAATLVDQAGTEFVTSDNIVLLVEAMSTASESVLTEGVTVHAAMPIPVSMADSVSAVLAEPSFSANLALSLSQQGILVTGEISSEHVQNAADVSSFGALFGTSSATSAQQQLVLSLAAPDPAVTPDTSSHLETTVGSLVGVWAAAVVGIAIYRHRSLVADPLYYWQQDRSLAAHMASSPNTNTGTPATISTEADVALIMETTL
jgi:hypothetical protein